MAEPNLNPTPKTHLGTGFSFPLRQNVQGNLKLSAAETNIEESIRLILGTKRGERVYRPNFGSRLSELVFAPMNSQTLLLTRIYVEEALTQWEPRITLEGVYTEPDPIRGCLKIIINYRAKDAHDSRSMVYPFYLVPSQEL
ncbi:GPW/gp25 family protein [Spirulina sp. CS-785/01]|uniref:GPW/gp25 family protein n=1 Tax=Spirulina sp. CS-785/01 TaxID=3021716 RepID=UPI0023303091|nr:GPW/gp25 family protein [Spirulina sp. CS-785/01]MDB9312793.1 GPW/gp25 family protein [Spirulina sp. CS-785/01]